jgi:hypothetical protein
VPDGRAGEAGYHIDAEGPRRRGRPLHLLDGPPRDALGVAVPPHAIGQQLLVAFVHPITDGLAHEVLADGPHVQVVLLQLIALFADVSVFFDGPVDVKMVPRADQLQAVVAPTGGAFGEGVERHVRPLSGEKCDGSVGHGRGWSLGFGVRAQG